MKVKVIVKVHLKMFIPAKQVFNVKIKLLLLLII